VNDYEVLLADQHRRMPWANGAGMTTEIIAWPSPDAWEWRLSVADVDSSGPFSAYPGVDRTIALLRGNGFALTVGEHEERRIDRPFEPFQFSGDEPTSCRLLDGAVQDLNLMCRRVTSRRRLEFVEFNESATIDVTDCEMMVVVSGRMRVGQQRLGYLDAVRHVTAPSLAMQPTGRESCVIAQVRRRP
jgi:uncharacterized protein